MLRFLSLRGASGTRASFTSTCASALETAEAISTASSKRNLSSFSLQRPRAAAKYAPVDPCGNGLF